jgi:hypothetical protein
MTDLELDSEKYSGTFAVGAVVRYGNNSRVPTTRAMAFTYHKTSDDIFSKAMIFITGYSQISHRPNQPWRLVHALAKPMSSLPTIGTSPGQKRRKDILQEKHLCRFRNSRQDVLYMEYLHHLREARQDVLSQWCLLYAK